MRNLTRRGLLTGAAVLALKPLTVPLHACAEGFAVSDLTRAVEALQEANVASFAGHYLAFVPPGIRHLFAESVETCTGRVMVIVDDPLLDEAQNQEAGRWWTDEIESRLMSHEGRS